MACLFVPVILLTKENLGSVVLVYSIVYRCTQELSIGVQNRWRFNNVLVDFCTENTDVHMYYSNYVLIKWFKSNNVLMTWCIAR